jgi:hypothetical protein
MLRIHLLLQWYDLSDPAMVPPLPAKLSARSESLIGGPTDDHQTDL